MSDFVWSGEYKFKHGSRDLSVWCECVDTCEVRRVELREAGTTLGCVDLSSCSFNQWVYLFSQCEFEQATKAVGQYVTYQRLTQDGSSYVLEIDPYNVLASASGDGLTVAGRITREIIFHPSCKSY